MAEEKERTVRDWASIILPRVLRATLWGFIMGGELLIPLQLPSFGGQIESLFPQSQMSFTNVVLIFVVFEVAIQLLQGTVVRYAFSIARTIVSMVALFLATNGGVISITISSSAGVPLPPGQTIIFTVDFSAVLGIFLIFSLLTIVKNLLQAIDFLSQKAEEPVTIPEFP